MNWKNVLIAVLVLAAVFVGWYAYRQGYGRGTADNEQDIEINLP